MIQRGNKGNQDQNQQPQQPAGQSNYNQQGGADFSQQNHQTHQGVGDQGGKTQPRGMRRINEVLRRGATSERSEARVSEALKQLNKAADEAIETKVMEYKPDLLRLDRQIHNLPMSAIIATLQANVNGVTYIAIRPLLLESRDNPLPKRRRQVGGQSVEMQLRAQDVTNDPRFWERVQKLVQDHAKIANAKIVDAGVLLIPEYVRDEDVGFDFENLELAKELISQTANRLEDALSAYRNETPLSLPDIMSSNDRLRVSVDTTSDTVEMDAVGNPIRSDLRVTMKIATQQNGFYGQQNGEEFMSEEDLNHVSAYVDMEYTRPNPQQIQQQQMMMGNNFQPPRPFTPVIVATRVANASWVQSNTMELYLLAFSNLYRCLMGQAYAQTLNPSLTNTRVGKNDVNTKDIAALGYMVGGQKPDIRTESTGDNEFIKFLNATVEGKPAFAIDVDPVGENISLESHFLVAASGGADSQRAKDYITAAANALTGGAFSRHFDASKEMFIYYGSDMHLGRYKDKNKEWRDVRDCDTVHVLNVTQGNQNDFFGWYRTRLATTDINETFETKLARRENLERQYLDPSMVINRRAPRLIATQEFLDALDAATAEAGARVEMDNIVGLDTNQFMGNTMIGSYAVGGSPRMNSHGPSVQQGGLNYSGFNRY